MLPSFISLAFVDIFLNKEKEGEVKLHYGSGTRLGRKFPGVYALATSRNLEDFLILNRLILVIFVTLWFLVVFIRIK